VHSVDVDACRKSDLNDAVISRLAATIIIIQ